MFNHVKKNCDIPFLGGFAGFFSYDYGLLQLGLKPIGKQLCDVPYYYGGLYDVVLYADHVTKKAGFIITDQHPTDMPEKRRDKILSLCQKPFIPKGINLKLKPLWQKEQYEKAVNETRSFIQKGDIFQANIARYYQGNITYNFCTLSYYKILRQINTAPFGCYIAGDNFNIMSSSPERFIRLNGNHIETRPIKGTLSVNYTPSILEKSEKDRAENIMIVDMLRNDIAQSAETGSVSVPELCTIETYEGLHHMVSSVTAQKKKDIHPAILLKKALPGGSVTGAPKKHACHIINQIEGIRRGAYCGTAGYISFSGHIDSNILIRTVVADKEHITFGTGCGITYASDAVAEYEESALKADKILRSLGQIS